jgi:prepilin-type N-terminal cleavage/methylation domain-containing protein
MREKGFTIIELLVVMGIITIMTVVLVPNFRLGQQQLALDRSANKLAQEIRRVQEMAISSKEIGQGIVPLGEEFYPLGGFGIYFDQSPLQITLFADCDDNQRFSSGNICGSPPDKFRENIEDLGLELGIQIENLFPSSSFSVTFKAPDPLVCIDGDCSDPSSAVITISLIADSSKTRIIRVNSVGLITVE